MSQTPQTSITAVGIDIGKNSFHIVGQDDRGAIVLRQKWSRGQVEARFANMPPCLIGMEACVDRGRQQAAASQRARHRACQQARPYRLERSCSWSSLRGEQASSRVIV